MVALAAALLAVSAWAVYDQMSEESVPGDIEQLLDGYLAAFNNQDETAFRAAVTEDYLLNEYVYLDYAAGDRTGAYLHERVEDADANRVAIVSLSMDWQTEQVGRPIVTGDGPWFVAVGENWNYEQSLQLDGVASYVIVERDGALRIDNHSWAGLQTAAE